MASSKKEVKTITAKEAARQVLAEAGTPLNLKVICERVMQKKNLKLGGKTPEATIAAVLHVSAKRGELFKKVGKSLFELIPEQEAAKAEATTDGDAEPAKPKTRSRSQKAAPAVAAAAADGDGHDPRGDVPGTVILKQGGEPKAKAAPKRAAKKEPVAA